MKESPDGDGFEQSLRLWLCHRHLPLGKGDFGGGRLIIAPTVLSLVCAGQRAEEAVHRRVDLFTRASHTQIEMKGSETKMQAVIGFVLGIVTVILIREYPSCKPRERRKVNKEQEQLRREYENFLSYDGEEQR